MDLTPDSSRRLPQSTGDQVLRSGPNALGGSTTVARGLRIAVPNMTWIREIDDASGFSSQTQLRCAVPSTLPGERPMGMPLASERFRLLGRLGQGGMAVVYRAMDCEMRREVALKSLSVPRADDLHRLKQEFRLLASLDHPNLVRVHELFTQGCHAFFTMDLLFGSELHTFVSGDAAGDSGRCDYRRLRGSARELASALATVHAAGSLHRDVTPSNIVVTPAGRLVLFDFGLAASLCCAQRTTERAGVLLGTRGYISPEQARGEALGPSADWYSFGVTLFEAATGRLPFDEPLGARPAQLNIAEAPRMTKYLPDAPADLDELVAGLLSPVADARPSEADILRILGVSPAPAPSRRPSAHQRPLLDHPDESATFARAVSAVRRGHSAIVRLTGSAGVGKSDLAHRFVDEAQRAGALVLRGRCRSQESVAFNALDEVVDDLSRALEHVPYSELLSVLSPHVAALVQLFPVLGRIEAILEGKFVDIREDDKETLPRARGALKDLLAGLADGRPLVIWIDDAQRGDRASGELLRYLLEVGAPPILLLFSYRNDEGSNGGTLNALCDVDASWLSFDLVLGQTLVEVPGDAAGRLPTVVPPPFERAWSST
jgi:eukaryotic-like serine/threonine-protein kinase